MNVPALAEGAPITMSTVEIAKRTGKAHRNVMRDARQILVELHGAGDLLKFEHVYRDPRNRTQRCYSLPKREVMVLVTGYSIPLRAAVIDRLEELERERRSEGGVPAALNDPATLRSLLLAQTERVLVLEAQVGRLQHQEPAPSYSDDLADLGRSVRIGEAGRLLGISGALLESLMLRTGWLFRRWHQSALLAHQDRLRAGELEYDADPVNFDRFSAGIRITPRGLVRLAQEI